jgi:hypothetical protein
MRYEITENQGITIIHVFNGNILFGFDGSDDYAPFRNALIEKGIDEFVDLLIADSNTAFLRFTDQLI